MGDPFAHLPAELLLLVLKDLGDLAVVHSLRCASPAVAAVFQNGGLAVEIFEAVLVKSLWKRLRRIVRATCLLIARPPVSWMAFWDNLQATRMAWALSDDSPVVHGHVSAAAIRRLLALASAVYAATNRCLYTLLERCSRLRPRRPLDPAFNWRNLKYWRYSVGKPYVPPPPFPDEPACDETAMTAGAAAPIAAVEAQRALNAGWQLAFYSVLREALAWESADTRRRATADMPIVETDDYFDPLESPLHLWRRMYPVANRVIHYLETFVEADLGPYTWTLQLPSPPPCLRLADAFPEAKTAAAAGAIFDYTGHPTPMPPDWKPGLAGLGASREPPAFISNIRVTHWSPLRHTSSAPFRRLGVHFWERPRMVALHLFSGEETIQTRFGGSTRLAEYSDIYTWYSLLTDEERLALQDVQRAKHGPS